MEQVARIERVTDRTHTEIRHGGRMHTVRRTSEVAYVITSLYPEQAGPEELLDIVRSHWTVEAMHHIRDVTYGEDLHQAHTGSGPQAMAGLRNLAIGLLRGWSFKGVPDGHRYFVHRLDDLFARLAI